MLDSRWESTKCKGPKKREEICRMHKGDSKQELASPEWFTGGLVLGAYNYTRGGAYPSI